MKRREFIAGLSGAAAWPVVARAQQARPRPLVGWLGAATPKLGARNLDAFLQGLREHGHEDGKTVDIVYRWAEGDLSRDLAKAVRMVAARQPWLPRRLSAPIVAELIERGHAEERN